MKLAKCNRWLQKIPRAGFFLAYLAWGGALYWLSAQPGRQDSTMPFPHFDKILHFSYFAGGAFLLSSVLLRVFSRVHVAIFLTMLAGILIGRLDEFHQSLVPFRSGNDINDFLADMLGTVAGIWLARLIHEISLSRDEKRLE